MQVPVETAGSMLLETRDVKAECRELRWRPTLGCSELSFCLLLRIPID